MAFLKPEYVNGAGVATEYWRVIDYKISTLYNYVDITFGGWFNEECRVNKLEMSDTPRKVRCMADKYEEYFGLDVLNSENVNALLQMYKFAKENTEFFSDTVDLLD